MIAAVALSYLDLGLASLLILLGAGLSLALRLNLERRLLLAALRATVQLALLGLVLGWVFRSGQPWAVLAVGLAMATIAGVEAVRRSVRRVPGVFRVGIGVMLVSSMFVTLYSLNVVIDAPGPWWEPQYSIPILGMVLGNSLNGIALGLDTALEGFDRERAQVELLLAHGATRREASAPIVRNAVRRGTIPILNSMIAVGIISIPGMMTGQMLAGEDPAQAARYQLFILFAIAGGVALGTVGVVISAAHLIFDERDRLRVDRLSKVGKG